MKTHADILWLTLAGLSFLFVGGFVLWVYGTRDPQIVEASGPEAEAAHRLHSDFVHWFLLYGGACVFAGAGCLLTALMIIL